MDDNLNSLRRSQLEYFSSLYAQFSNSHKAVGSESLEHKKLRYSKILEPILKEKGGKFSLHDVGMGLGHLYEYILESGYESHISYSGSDIYADYIKDFSIRYPEISCQERDLAITPGEDLHDWLILSGVFHQIRENSEIVWESFMHKMLVNCFSMCKKGLVLNLVSPYVDYVIPGIYHANIEKILDFINSSLSRFFIIQHDYVLYEYTVHILHKPYVLEQFTGISEFKKYTDVKS
jgi:hypothetical protein